MFSKTTTRKAGSSLRIWQLNIEGISISKSELLSKELLDYDAVLPCHDHPSIYAGDFNSHHQNWGYSMNDDNGTQVNQWSEYNNLWLVYDAKDKGTFHSARWRRDYNPDLVFVSMDNNQRPLLANRNVLGNFPRSQHRPVIMSVGLEFPLVNCTQKPRWNFNLANWEIFQEKLDQMIRYITPSVKHYDRFVGAIIAAAKLSIPRGFRKQYIPCWSAEAVQRILRFRRPRSC